MSIKSIFINMARKRLLSMIAGVGISTFVSIFHSKLGMDLAQAQELATQVVTAVSVYILGQSASDTVGVLKGTKTP